jgi:hypothetical protein
MEHQYGLAKKGKRICPECKRKTYVLYIDNNTGEFLHPSIGKCDRADNCGHHYTPKRYFADNNISFDVKREYASRSTPKPQPEPSFIDTELMKRTLNGYGENRLFQYLCKTVGGEAAKEAVQRYFVGTSRHWDGSTVFWQIDGTGRVHAGKIMQYDSQTGKRIKEPVNRITWAHAVLKLRDFHLSQCLFGEHLLKGNNNPVAIVESEKTAVIGSIYLPDMIWLACGGSEGLNPGKCKCLTGRRVILYPDAGMFDKWNSKAGQLRTVCASVAVSDLIEKQKTELQPGIDLADILVRVPLIEHVNTSPISGDNDVSEPAEKETVGQETNQTSECQPQRNFASMAEMNGSPHRRNFKHNTKDWEREINSLEACFAKIDLPAKPVKLNSFTTITDASVFLENHFATVKANIGNPIFLPYLTRLQELKKYL